MKKYNVIASANVRLRLANLVSNARLTVMPTIAPMVLMACALSESNLVDPNYETASISADGSELVCRPGCKFSTDDQSGPPPVWCKEWEKSDDTGDSYCVKLDLNQISNGTGDFAPVLVFGTPETGDDIYRVDCRPGCELPISKFGCAKPFDAAPKLTWCATVKNACGSGRRQLVVGVARPTPEGPEENPMCSAINVE